MLAFSHYVLDILIIISSTEKHGSQMSPSKSLCWPSLSRYLRNFSLRTDRWVIAILARREGGLGRSEWSRRGFRWTARGCWPEVLSEPESRSVARVAGSRQNRPALGARRSWAVAVRERAAWESFWWVVAWLASSAVALSRCWGTSGSPARRSRRCSWPGDCPSATGPRNSGRGNTYRPSRSPKFCSSAKRKSNHPIVLFSNRHSNPIYLTIWDLSISLINVELTLSTDCGWFERLVIVIAFNR